MRLQKVATGHSLYQKLRMAKMRWFGTYEPHDMLRLMLYRRSFFGRPFEQLHRSVMHGESEWSAGERQLFATFVSSQNQCPF